MKATRRAFTLSEMLVYIGVLSVFTTALYSVVILTVRHFNISEARSDATHQNLKAVMQVNRILSGGANGTLQVQADPPALMFLSAEPATGKAYLVNGAGELLWQKWVCIRYDAQTSKILSSTLALNPATATPPTPPTFVTMASQPSRMLAREITGCTLAVVDPRTISYSISSGVVPSVSTHLVGADARIGATTSGLLTLRN